MEDSPMILDWHCGLVLDGDRFCLLYIRYGFMENNILEKMGLLLADLRSIHLVNFQAQKIGFSNQRDFL